MDGIVKALTGVLGALAIIACLTTIGVVGYTLGTGSRQADETAEIDSEQADSSPVPTIVPETAGNPDSEIQNQPVSLDTNHTHDYKESVEVKATCYRAGRLKYTCDICGDVYYVDVLSQSHESGEWETEKAATESEPGLRVRKCIYCDEIMGQETIPALQPEEKEEKEAHIHQYTAIVEREASCVLAGLRRYDCSCGNFYTQSIPAMGHVATDWTVAEEAGANKMGREQRTCTACGVVLDSRPIQPSAASSQASPSASGSAQASASASATAAPSASASAAPSSSASASASPSSAAHVHNFNSYVLKQATCTEKGIRSFVCGSCGSSYAEQIDLDLNNHNFQATVIPPAASTEGYTIYRCTRCNFSYNDNYLPALTRPTAP